MKILCMFLHEPHKQALHTYVWPVGSYYDINSTKNLRTVSAYTNSEYPHANVVCCNNNQQLEAIPLSETLCLLNSRTATSERLGFQFSSFSASNSFIATDASRIWFVRGGVRQNQEQK